MAGPETITPSVAEMPARAAAESRSRRVLVVEDDAGLRQLIQKALGQNGFATLGVGHGAAALAQLEADPRLLLLLDQRLPDMAGNDLIAALRARGLRVPFVVMTGQGSERLAVEMMKLGASDYLVKTLDLLDLLPGVLQRLCRELDREDQLQAAAVALRESEARYRTLFDSNPQPMLIYDLETLAIREVNEAAVRHYGWTKEEFLAMSIQDLRPPEDIPALLAAVARARHQPIQTDHSRHRKKNGELIQVENVAHSIVYAGRPARHVLILDITQRLLAEQEKERLQRQLLQAQKMEAIGRLAGGVAHDFNNMLAATMLQLELLAENTTLSDEVRATVQELEAEAVRAANLTRQLLLYSRRAVMQTAPRDLGAIVDNLLNMLRRVVGENYRLEFKPPPQLAPVNVDAGMIEQVVLNLVVNARDAMPGGGTVHLTLYEQTWTEQDLAAAPKRRSGHFVGLAVTDTGSGIAPELREKIFEPFYTTKDVGQGTGLGLPTVEGIVTQHLGWIEVESEVGHGSTFRVYLPAWDKAVAASVAATVDTPPQAGRETILLVEDEKAVRVVARRNLEQLGYRILAAQHPQEAVALWEQQGGAVDLLLTDMVMPGGQSGLELVRQLRRMRPALPAIIMSGYAEDLTRPSDPAEPQIAFLGKPFTVAALTAMIRRQFSAPPRSPA